MAAGPIRRKSKRWSRDSTGAAVAAIFCGSVVANTKTTPGRRLLQNLEQRVPRLAGEHVGFVHDVDLVVALLRGGVHRALAQLARVVHTAVARGVDLHHVEVGRAVPDPRQFSHSPHGSPDASRLGQLSAMARMRAAVVFPTPRGPVRR